MKSFSQAAYSKISPRAKGPLCIVECINDNATFNLVDLSLYLGDEGDQDLMASLFQLKENG